MKIQEAQIDLERDRFLRSLLRELSGTLQEVVGTEEAAGFISIVGQKVGLQILELYREGMDTHDFTREELADILVDLKRRIEGDFYIISQDDDKIVLGNRRCPFEDKVLDRPSLCMMTSNVFGVIAAETHGYAKVCLNETIAVGDVECHVTVYLRPTDESNAQNGREYFKTAL